MLDFLKNSKVLITGHTGFKGSWLTSILHERCAKILGVSLPITQDNKLYVDLDLENKIYSKYINLVDFKQTEKVIKDFNPDYVFHFAAQSLVQTGYSDPITTFKSNVIGTQNLLEALYRNEIDATIIIATTDKVYKNDDLGIPFKEVDELGGIDPYSASKAATEILIHSYYRSYFESRNTKIGVARAGNVVGGGDWSENRIVPDIIRAVINDSTLKIRAPESTRPWQHVLEPLFGYLKFAKWLDQNNASNFEIINFGPEKSNVRKVKEVVSQMLVYFPELKVVTEYPKNKEAKSLSLNVDKAKKLLNIKSKLDFEKTIYNTANWYRSFNSGNHPMELCQNEIEKYINNE